MRDPKLAYILVHVSMDVVLQSHTNKTYNFTASVSCYQWC